MGKRFIRVAAVLLLLLLTVLEAERELTYKAAEEQGEGTMWGNAGTLEESGQDAELIAQDRNDIVVKGAESVDERGRGERIEQYYGTYRITEFWPTVYYRALNYDTLPEQEADMMLGRIVEIGEDQLITYDSFLWIGLREGGYAFWGNYLIEEIFIPHPQYEWESLDSNTKWYEEMEYHNISDAISKEYCDVIEGRMSIQVAESWYKHEYYVMKDGIIMYSWLTGQYFYLEKLNEKPDRILLQNELSDDDVERILQELYGTYTVTKFLPTKFYPALDSNGDVRLPQEEADMMIGKEIVIVEDLFVTYDNYRLPNSLSAGRAMDEFYLESAEILNPDYRLKILPKDEIYGLRDEMLPEELVQDTYIRINVFPGYGSRTDWSETLPQLYLLDDGRMIMYAMGEYFLIEKSNYSARQDDMTAILTKGDNLFLAERISDPEEDHIYRTLP